MTTILKASQKDGVTTFDITPYGIKLLAAFAACSGRGGYAPSYFGALEVLEIAPHLTGEEVIQWVEDYEAFVAAERDREFGPSPSGEVPLQTSNLQ